MYFIIKYTFLLILFLIIVMPMETLEIVIAHNEVEVEYSVKFNI